MGNDSISNKYYKLFNEKQKAEAFDKIAEKFYFANFGSTTKSDFETLLFSIYIERILDESVDSPNTYSDYTLSKCLGINQAKINKLKVQKELKYPRVGFDWKSAFLQCLDNAYIEKGKIKVFIDDPNVAIEVKHAIEINGGFTDSSFNSKICIIGPADFLDLLCITCPEKKPEEIKKKIIKTIEKNNDVLKFIESETLAVQIKKAGIELGFDILDGVLKTVPVIGNVLPNLREQITNIAGNKINARKVQKQMKSKKRGE